MSNTTQSNFDFLAIWDACTELQARAKKAEAAIKSDPRVSCFYARNCVELMVETVFEKSHPFKRFIRLRTLRIEVLIFTIIFRHSRRLFPVCLRQE